MTRLVPCLVLVLAIAIACGGAREEAREPGTAPDSKDIGPTQPVWDDVDNSAYKFYRAVSKTLLRTNQPLRASRTIQRLLKLKPDEPEPYYLMGRAYVGMRQYDSAKKMFKKAIEKDEEYAEAHSMLGVVLNMVGDHRQAEKAHQRAIEIDGESASFYNNLGFGFYLQGRYSKAVKAYKDALERDPGARRIHNNLGFAYGKLGQFEDAFKHFKLAGLPAQASNNMGFVHESRGELERAYEYYVIALEQDPALIQARKNLERVCVELNRPVPDYDVKYEKEEADEIDTSSPDS